MAASPLLRRYRVTERGAKKNLAEALRERDIVLVAMDGSEIVGLAWLIGAALLARGEQRSRSLGCRHVVMLVTRTNRRARSFYERHGYAHIGDLAGYARPGIGESVYVKSWR